ncbi:MAG: hypothetical protein ABH875_02330 [Candidatus Omnitrophota bacterium]
MNEKIDFKKVQTRVTKALKQAGQHLEGVGKETKDLMRRGEDELVKISKMGKTQFEILALSVRKEQLYRQIGMKVWQLSTKGKLTTSKLKEFCKELSSINKKLSSKKKVASKTPKKG